MVSRSRYDDPEFISKFLDVMNARPLSPVNRSRPQAPVTSSNMDPESPEFSPGCLRIDNKSGFPEPDIATPQCEVQQSEPEGGTPSWQTPRSSPFPRLSDLQETSNADLVQDENGFVVEIPVPAPAAEEQVLMSQQPNIRTSYRGKYLTPTQHRLLMGKKPGVERLTESKLSEMQQQTHGYMDNVIEGFRKLRQPMVSTNQANGQGPASPAIKHSSGSETGSISFPEMDETPIHPEAHQTHHTNLSEISVKHEDWQEEKANTVPFNIPVVDSGGYGVVQQKGQPLEVLLTSNETPIISTSDDIKLFDHGSQALSTPAKMSIVKHETAPPSPTAAAGEQVSTREQGSLDGGVQVENNPKASDDAFNYSQSPTIVVAANTETDDNVTGRDNVEAREKLARFKSWGTPTARDKPKSRQRTIILSGLPRSADLTLVQSLIHGGAIDCMRLVSSSPESPSVSAHVTFISPDACDQYYDKYPNGFDVRHQGKKWPVLVSKRDGVDVVSGMLQGYLECGATRVVKVNNADDDWGIVALNKLAEGKAGTRQVEAVHDTYHNRTRTIIFRFANISHAVKFKGILIRSDDWEGCHVEFAEDPCASATGVHNK
ncbi:hypothetical protein PV04_02252 [Phialophora macrospora]|uniref:Uncharacterized protein n=1 Tax=Phialophora macrospora TaxID=1851006 RepID=A0A0D2FTU0_9EURO|nr:hypothetical protein PV04_02252 [Phialophora macrospora]